MIDALIFVCFIIYTLVIFMLKNYLALLIVALINISLMFICKVPIKKAISNLLFLTGFILFTATFNLILDSLESAIMISIRLYLVCNITYTFKYILSPMALANAIETLSYPLKIFKVNPKDISIIVNIAIAFIPILSDEFSSNMDALKAKGVNLKSRHIIKNLQYLFKPILVSIFKKTSEIVDALNAKGYIEN